jgi:hypothetical protein
VSLDPTRPCIDTSNTHIKIHVRIHSTVNVIRACLFIMWSVLDVTQRVPPTCTLKTSRTCTTPPTCVGRGRGVFPWHPWGWRR